MAMKLVREGKKTEYKQENGQIITVVQPEVYQRIYCKNCNIPNHEGPWIIFFVKSKRLIFFVKMLEFPF